MVTVKKDQYAKIKLQAVIFFLINLMLQPLCILNYVNSKIPILSALLQIILGLFIFYSFSVVITEYAIKKIFLSITGGTIIKNPASELMSLIYWFLLLFAFILWLISFIEHEYNFFYFLAVLPYYNFFYQSKWIAVNDTVLILLNDVIELDAIHHIELKEHKGTGVLTLILKDGKNKKANGDIYFINELSTYLQGHNILQYPSSSDLSAER